MTAPTVALLLALVQAATDVPDALQPWLGVYEASPEKITISWAAGGLRLQMDLISLPVDGQWHETFATFGVRQRATWLTDRQVIRLEEQHNYRALEADDESGWRFELRLDKDTRTLLKVVQQPDQTDLVVRRYQPIEGDN